MFFLTPYLEMKNYTVTFRCLLEVNFETRQKQQIFLDGKNISAIARYIQERSQLAINATVELEYADVTKGVSCNFGNDSIHTVNIIRKQYGRASSQSTNSSFTVTAHAKNHQTASVASLKASMPPSSVRCVVVEFLSVIILFGVLLLVLVYDIRKKSRKYPFQDKDIEGLGGI